MLNRNYNLKLDLQFRCNNPNMEFNQFDKNTSDFFIKINRSGKGIDLSKALVTLMVIKPNGNVDSQFLEVAENGVYANLKPSLKDIPGDYQCRAIITTKDETVIPDQIFTYTVNEDKFLTAFNQNMTSDEDYSLLTDILGRLSTVETDEEQRQINEAERILKEEARQVAENKRVEAELVREHNDADREKAEATRETSEHDRQLAENTRNSNESKRIENENARVEAETKRVEAENVRNENYEFMTSDEERRRNEENQRIKDEKLRVEAEKARVNEESRRRTTEQARVLKENERNSKETERESNEVARKSNEEKRVQSETTRSDRYNAFISDAENTVNNFKAYTSTANQEEETRKANEIARIDMENKRNSNEAQRISDENTRKDSEDRRVEAETNRQSKFNSKVSEVNSKIVEVTAAKDAMIADTREVTDTMKKDVANAIAAGTNDLEVKEARKDANGIVHDTLKQRLKSDLTIDNKSLKDFVVDMNNMKEFQDLEYKSDTGYLVCKDTRNGVVKDMKVYGKSLINHFNTMKQAFNVDIDISKKWTIDLKTNDTDKQLNIKYIYTDGTSGNDVALKMVGEVWNSRLIPFTAIDKTKTIKNISLYWLDGGTCEQQMILEGDHTQNPPQYFEGMKSVGDGADKIEVSTTLPGCRKNIAISTIAPYPIASNGVGYVLEDVVVGNLFVNNYSNSSRYMVATFDSLEGRTPSIERFDLTGKNGEQVVKITQNAKYAVLYLEPSYNETTKGCIYQRHDKKPLLFKDTDGTWKPITELRGIDSNTCDTIENNIFTNNIGFKNLVGIENYIISTSRAETTLFILNSNEIKKNSKCLCDKLNVYSIGDLIKNDVEGIAMHDTLQRVVLSISKSKADTVEKLKTYITNNNINFLYEKNISQTYEVNPLEVESFENETMISFRSGVIAPYASWKITSYLPNFVRNLANQVKQLQEQVYKTNLANFTVALNTLDTKLRLDRLESPQM